MDQFKKDIQVGKDGPLEHGGGKLICRNCGPLLALGQSSYWPKFTEWMCECSIIYWDKWVQGGVKFVQSTGWFISALEFLSFLTVKQ